MSSTAPSLPSIGPLVPMPPSIQQRAKARGPTPCRSPGAPCVKTQTLNLRVEFPISISSLRRPIAVVDATAWTPKRTPASISCCSSEVYFSPFQNVNLFQPLSECQFDRLRCNVQSVGNIMATAIAAHHLIAESEARPRGTTKVRDQDILGRSGSVPEARQICRRYAPSRGRILGMQAYS